MKRLLFLAAIFMMIVAAVFVAGCSSDDDDNGTGSTKQTGDINDPEFQMIADQFEGADFMTLMMLDFIGGITDSVLTEGGSTVSGTIKGRNPFATADSISLTYHSNTGYWYVYYSEDSVTEDGIDGYVNMIMEDSIQYKHGTSVVQWPDTLLLTEITNGISLSYTNTGEQTSYIGAQVVNIVGDSLLTNYDATLNGNQSLMVDFSADSCSFGIDLTANFTNIVMNLEYGFENNCPSSGSIVYTGDIAIACTGDTTFTYNGGWTMSQTFSGSIATVIFENATTRWTMTDTCGPSVVKISEY